MKSGFRQTGRQRGKERSAETQEVWWPGGEGGGPEACWKRQVGKTPVKCMRQGSMRGGGTGQRRLQSFCFEQSGGERATDCEM